jgi:hypothetical protein
MITAHLVYLKLNFLSIQLGEVQYPSPLYSTDVVYLPFPYLLQYLQFDNYQAYYYAPIPWRTVYPLFILLFSPSG